MKLSVVHVCMYACLLAIAAFAHSQDAQPLPPTGLSIVGQLSANILLASGDNSVIGLPVLYVWTAQTQGVLTSTAMNCGDGTIQTQDLSNQPPASDGSLTITGVNYVSTASFCLPLAVGTLQPSLTVTDSLNNTVTVSTTNTTLPPYACGAGAVFAYNLPNWYLTPAPGPLTWTNPADIQYQATQYVTNYLPITSWTVSGSTVTFQVLNSFKAGQTIGLGQFQVTTALNGLNVVVLAAGLSATQFEATIPGITQGTDSGDAEIQVLAQIPNLSSVLPLTYTLPNYGKQYCLWLGAGGGTPPYTFSGVNLPPGLTISTVAPNGIQLQAVGLLSGIATTPGSYTNILFTVTDSLGNSATLAPRSMQVCVVGSQCNGFGSPAAVSRTGNSPGVKYQFGRLFSAVPGFSSATLTWSPDDSIYQVTSYNVYRSIGSCGGYSKLGSTAGLTYIDTLLAAGGTFVCYVVTAVNVTAESGFSTPVYGTLLDPQPFPPVGLTIMETAE